MLTPGGGKALALSSLGVPAGKFPPFHPQDVPQQWGKWGFSAAFSSRAGGGDRFLLVSLNNHLERESSSLKLDPGTTTERSDQHKLALHGSDVV